MALREVDGGPGYFSQFANSLPSDPSFFPLGVWFESVTSQADINLDMAAGLNLYVVLTGNSNLSLIQNNGMYAILQQSEWRTNQAAINNPAVVGWELSDEIDMTQGPGQGYTTLNNILATLPNDGRFRYNNYGKGVMFWETDAQAEQFVNDFQQVTSVDTYWFTDPNIDGGSEGGTLLNNGNPLTIAQTRLAANYGYTVDRMRELDAMDGQRQPIWAFVEVGWPFTETAAQGGRAIEPEEIRAAVWHSIIAGARGIIYFNHSFGGPDQTQHALRDPDYAAQRAAVTETNALIEQLAPVLNAPFDDAFVTASPSVRVMAHFSEGWHYVFAASTQHAASAATFTLPSVTSGTATVINEGRTISITGGQFVDNFANGNAFHIYQINTDGAPTPTPGSVSINDVTISEGDSGTKVATFTVTRSGGTAAFDVNFATSNGTATTADSDYVAASNTLHFGANENTQTISVTINGDTQVEANETFNVVLSNATNGATISDSQGVGTITNDDGAVIAGSVSINDVTISEGNSGTTVATFTVTRSGGTAAFDVNFATSNGTATTADSDYVAASNTLHFGANENTQTISVTINGDTQVEANETFNVVLSNATNGATISDSQGVGTITNDDGVVIAGSVSINDVTISEGDSGTKVATFTVTRSGGTAAFDVNFATSNATATAADSDYVAASNTLHFGANDNTQTISVTINGDTTVEANETFNVLLSNATNGATISDSQGVGTITNDDVAPTANLVANGGFETGSFSGWTLSGNSSGIYIAPTAFPGEVHTGSYSAGLGSMNRTDGILTQNIATTAGQHYTLGFWIASDNDGLTPINHFAAEWNGQTLMALTDAPDSGYQLYTFDVVGINGNSVLEFDAYNHPDAWRLDDVTLTAVGVAIAGSISINDVTISEGDSGTTVATFTVTRGGGTAAFDVNFATSNATATTADSDYVAASNTVHFGANENTQTISVTINGDTQVEANETFNVVLSNATNGATISDSQGVGTITNDDGAVIAGSVSINDVTISEGDSGTKVATFTVTRSGGTAAFDVNFATSNATATTADSDYVAASNTVHFGANENTQTISVTINGDTTVEANETFDVVLSNATNGATISDSQGVGTITNDDVAPTANLVANGGFETGNFSGWTLSGNSSGIYIAPTAFPGEVHTGSYSAGLGSMNRTDGILTQNIATTAGQHYTLGFWIASDNDGLTPINHFAAEWNGQTLMALTDAPDSGYQLYTFDVVGINGNSVLEFDAYNHPDAWRLDDVTLTAVGVAIAGSISINDVTISEGDSGTTVATFTVTRGGGTAAFDVNFATSNATATTADSDYVAASNTLHFGANENTQTISVTINGDTQVEANETFNVVLSNATNGATISDSQGVGTITNDDGVVIAGSVSINDVTISEGDSGTTVATFTVTRSGGTAAFDVNFATSNATATAADSDYVAASNTLHFGANDNTQTISVTINGDTTVEANETFNVLLSNATNGATISDSQGVGTITNDDDAAVPVTPIFTSGADTVTLPLLGGTFNALGGDDKLAYTGGPVTIDGGTGIDTVDFSQFGSAVWVNLANTSRGIWTQDRPDLVSDSWREIGDLTNVENLVGTAYSDFLQGNSGANTLQGGDGNDTLMGWGDADTFFFDHLGADSQHQHDVIVDFRPGVDRIDLAATPVNDFADLFTFGDRYMEQVGNDVLIHTSVSADTSILLRNVTLWSVTQSDFLF